MPQSIGGPPASVTVTVTITELITPTITIMNTITVTTIIIMTTTTINISTATTVEPTHAHAFHIIVDRIDDGAILLTKRPARSLRRLCLCRGRAFLTQPQRAEGLDIIAVDMIDNEASASGTRAQKQSL